MGFVIERVLADSFYGEARCVMDLLGKELKFPYIVAIRSTYGRIMMPGHQICYNRWRACDQPLKNQPTQRRLFISALLVMIQAEEFEKQHNNNNDDANSVEPFAQHPHWESGCNGKSSLNNLRLLIQSYWYWVWLKLWFCIFPIPGLRRAAQRLFQQVDTYRIRPSPITMTKRSCELFCALCLKCAENNKTYFFDYGNLSYRNK